MTLDDLGRAAAAKADEGTPEGMYLDWDDLHSTDKDYWRGVSLAAVEWFAAALTDDILYFDESHPKDKIRNLLSSLRAEAGQVK